MFPTKRPRPPLSSVRSIQSHTRKNQHDEQHTATVHTHRRRPRRSSKPDRRLTERLKQSLDLVDIRLPDHLVVGGMEVVSFAERGWL